MPSIIGGPAAQRCLLSRLLSCAAWVELPTPGSPPRPLLLQLMQIMAELYQQLRQMQHSYPGHSLREAAPLMGPALRELVGYSAQLELQQLRRNMPVSRMSRLVQHLGVHGCVLSSSWALRVWRPAVAIHGLG